MFEGFVDEAVPVGAVTLQVRHALNATPREAPTFLLLRGHPHTSATWHRVAVALRELGHGVVCPDLRGYGRSSSPPTDAQHRPYSERAMAADVTAPAVHLGLGPVVVGHYR